MENIPNEILQEIFSYLESEDLWQCLQVSQRWRNAANSNFLWKKICEQIAVDEIPYSSVPGSLAVLCDWAAAFYVGYLLPVENWRSDRHRVFFQPVDDQSYIDCWQGNRGLVYYYSIDKLLLLELSSEGLISSSLQSPFALTPRQSFHFSLTINSNYAAISNCNIILIYEKTVVSYQPFKMFFVLDDELKSINYDEKSMMKVFSDEYLLNTKCIVKGSLWLEYDSEGKYFIIDLIGGTVNSIPADCFICHSAYSPFVVTWCDLVRVHDHRGKLLFQLNKECWDAGLNSKILVFGDKETQRIEGWRLKSKTKVFSRSVLYQTEITVHPKNELVVIGEKSIDLYRITCLDGSNGAILWRIVPQTPHRCHSVRIISEYVFIWYSHFSRRNYYIHQMKDGKLVREGIVSETEAHMCNTIWVLGNKERFKMISYLGS